MLYLFCIPPFLAFILVIWLNTEAFYEYTTQFRIYKKFKVLSNFKKLKDSGNPETFVEHIQKYYDSFFTRLITCEICLSSWLGLLGGLVASIYYLTIFGRENMFQITCLTLSFPYLTLFLYRLINKIK